MSDFNMIISFPELKIKCSNCNLIYVTVRMGDRLALVPMLLL